MKEISEKANGYIRCLIRIRFKENQSQNQIENSIIQSIDWDEISISDTLYMYFNYSPCTKLSQQIYARSVF